MELTNQMRAALAANHFTYTTNYGAIPVSFSDALRVDQVWKMFGSPRGLKKLLMEEMKRVNLRHKISPPRSHVKQIHADLTDRWEGRSTLEVAVKARYLDHARFAGNTYHRDNGDMKYVADYDAKENAALIRADGWCQYTRSYGHTINMAGLVIRDPDTRRFVFLRVPPDTQTVEEALDALKPAEVRKAENQGKQVFRQGDFYFIPQKRANLSALQGTRHAVTVNGKIEIDHPQHGKMIFSEPVKAVRQIQTANAGFGRGRNFAD
jgi:hypothetical protein